MLIFGSIGLFVKNINLSSSQIAFVRGITGCIFLLVACPFMKQKLSAKAIKANFIILLISGAAIGFNWILLFEAYKYTSIANATLSYYFAPVFVVFLSPLFLKERLTITKVICVLGAILGMFLVLGNGAGAGMNNVKGIVYGIFAASLYASVVILNKFLKGLSGIETTLIQLGAASLVILPYVLLNEKLQVFTLDKKSFLLLVIVGIFHTGLAYLLYFSAFRKLQGQTIAIFSYIDPISAILMSSLLLGEHMTVVQIFGGMLILGATFLSDLKKTNRLHSDGGKSKIGNKVNIRMRE